MENDILETLTDIGYEGPIMVDGYLKKALKGGPRSVDYTTLVACLSNEIKDLCNLDEHVNPILSSEDSSSFLLELSSFLKELGCAYTSLTEGHLSERLNTYHSRALLLDYLLSELEAARMIQVDKPAREKCLQVKVNESTTAFDLKTLLLALKFSKPPAQLTSAMLFEKVESKVKEVLSSAPKDLIGTPLFAGVLSQGQWLTLGELQTELHKEYQIRRQMLIKRLDVTIQSFQWSERVCNQLDEITTSFLTRRQAMLVEPDVYIGDLLAARDDLAIIEKTSSSTVRKNTQSSINKVIIGQVPDRGGRPNDHQPPPPEMPSWGARTSGDNRGRGGGRGGNRVQGGSGRGGDFGGGNKVQGGWQHGNHARGEEGGRGGHGGGWGRGKSRDYNQQFK